MGPSPAEGTVPAPGTDRPQGTPRHPRWKHLSGRLLKKGEDPPEGVVELLGLTLTSSSSSQQPSSSELPSWQASSSVLPSSWLAFQSPPFGIRSESEPRVPPCHRPCSDDAGRQMSVPRKSEKQPRPCACHGRGPTAVKAVHLSMGIWGSLLLYLAVHWSVFSRIRAKNMLH